MWYSQNMQKNLHWLLIGLILIAAFFIGKALVTYYVQPAPTANYPLTFYAEARVPYTQGQDLNQIRPQAYQQAQQKAQAMAGLVNKQLGKLTGVNETMNDNPSLAPDPAMQSPEASPSSQPKEYILGLTYELK
jgi:hypothetical protein